MKIISLACFFLITLFHLNVPVKGQNSHPTLQPGSPAPDFKLPGVDGKLYSLKDFKQYPLLVIIFTCNHCPTAQSYEDRIMQLVDDYREKGVGFLAVSPNDPLALRPDELGYTDLGDRLEDMKLRAEYRSFNFPYVYDGETQEMSGKYGPVATPHVFVFDQKRILRFTGRIDNSEAGVTHETSHDTRRALEELLAGKEVSIATTKTFGCSVKWSEKRDWASRFYTDLEKEKAELEEIDVEGIKALTGGKPEKLTLINVWSTWCGPCVAEFPDLVEINLMYRNRAFEFISISADHPGKSEEVLSFLEKQHATGRNYIYNSTDQYAMIDAVDVEWQGALPYTMLIAPGGKILYARQGVINPLEMKRRIVSVLGREKDW